MVRLGPVRTSMLSLIHLVVREVGKQFKVAARLQFRIRMGRRLPSGSPTMKPASYLTLRWSETQAGSRVRYAIQAILAAQIVEDIKNREGRRKLRTLSLMKCNTCAV